MSRRRISKKRKLLPDMRYSNTDISRFINIVMNDGKKSVAERIVYGALDVAVGKIGGIDPVELFDAVIENVRPAVELRSRRVGGATYQIPISVPVDRSKVLGMRYLKHESTKRREKTMTMRLAHEMCDAYNGSGATVKVREEKQRMADANKAFASFKW